MKSGKSLHENIAVQFMNSIFSNALPGENEDEHIYTLKDLFNQNDNENNENNNGHHHNFNSNNNSQIIEQRNISPNNKYKEYNSKDYSESNNKIMDYNNNSYNRNRSNSKSSSRSRGRERERERERSRERERGRERRESSSRKYSRSNSRNYRRTHQRDDEYRKRYDNKPKNTGRKYQKPYSKFCCVENGINKISTQFTVPENLVSLLIGKNGENVKSIMHSTGASVTFCKEVSFFLINL